MKEIDPGHIYSLQIIDGRSYEVYSNLVFVKRVGDKYPGNTLPHSGTNIQEVLRACIARLAYLDKQIPDGATQEAKMHLEAAVWYLELRAAKRHDRTPPKLQEAVNGQTCTKCGHVGCKGECHE